MRIELAGLPAGGGEPKLDLYVVDRVKGGQSTATWVTRVPHESSRVLKVDLDEAEGRRILLYGQGIWSEPCQISEMSCRLVVEPGGVSSVRLSRSTRGSPDLPDLLIARGWRRKAPPSEAEVPVLCRKLNEELVWTCALPRGSLDLRLDVPEFSPVFLWDVQVGADPAAQLLDARLLEGTSVEGWIDASAGTARLSPVGRWRDISEERLGFASRKVAIEADGRLHFEHVAQGSYELILSTPDARATRLEIVVEGGAERVLLGDIPVDPPEPAEIVIDPPADGRNETWRVTLSRVDDGARAAVKRVSPDLTGYARVERLRPGRYYVTVRDSRDSIWHLAAHELDGSAPLSLSIPHVPVEGRIRVGEEGLATTLVFGTTQGAKQIRFHSNERGRFAGYLPEEGLWEVELGTEDAGCDRCGGSLGVTLVPPVEVETGPGGKALVDIVLPDTVIEGRVLRGPRGDEVPIAGAQVMAVRPDGPPDRMGRLAQVWTDEEGEFTLRGIEPGRVAVGARTKTGNAESSWVELQLREDLDLPVLELRLEENVSLPVRILHEGAPVPGARIHAFPMDGSSDHSTTDLDGRADLSLAAPSSGVLLLDAPGFGLRIEPFGVGDGSPSLLDLEAATTTGNLLLAGFSAPPFGGYFVYRGAAIDLHTLRNFAHRRVRTTDDGVLYRGLEPGEYSVCLDSERECRNVTVTPGETVPLARIDGKERGR